MLLRKKEKCRSIEEYEKIERICRGNFGAVFKVKNKLDDKFYALKELNKAMVLDTNGFSILYLREINILKNLRHDNIIKLKEIVIGSEISDIFIVMEFCDFDLKTLIHCVKSIPLAVKKSLFKQIVCGLACLHENNILHRDIKPSNILINRNGLLKIADFGLARKRKSRMTNLVVTLWYRPLEILLGLEEYDFSIDVWSLGCVLLEMYTMKPIFPGEGEIDQISKIVDCLGFPKEEDLESYNLPHLSSLNRSIKCSLYFKDILEQIDFEGKDLIKNLLCYNPKKRYTADQILSSSYCKFNDSEYLTSTENFLSKI